MAALLLLLRLKTRGSFRQLWRSCQTIEGLVRAVFTLGFILLLFVPLISLMIEKRGPVPAEYIAHGRYAFDNIFPMLVAAGFLFVFLIPNNSKSLKFQRAEIDFLFSGPFSRRELLVYKLLGLVTSTLLISLGITCFIAGMFFLVDGNFLGGMTRGFLAIAFAILLIQLMYAWSGLLRQSVAIRLLTPIRKIASAAIVLLGIFAFFNFRGQVNAEMFDDGAKLFAEMQGLIERPAIQIAIAPFKMFSNLILSQSILESLGWATVCLAANLVALFLVLKTDEDFLEKELHASQHRAEVLKRTANMESALVARKDRFSLPMLPYLGGVGPITWRQLQTFFRMRMVLIAMFAFYLAMYVILIFTDRQSAVNGFRFSIGIAVLCMITMTLGTSVPMGFHTDVNKMDIFKSLPVSKWQVAAGQLLGPVLLISAIQFLCIGVFVFLAPDSIWGWVAAAAFCPLISTVTLSIFNSVSLLYPRQSDEGVARELENVGHLLVFLFLMLAAGGLIAVLLAGIGAAAYYATRSIPVTVVSCWVMMLISSATGVWLTGWTFGRFDVSKYRL